MAGSWRGLVVLLLVCLVQFSAASSPPSDVDALQGLLRAWQKTPGLVDEWSLDKDADPCGSHWKGVRCCHMNNVVSLDLSNVGVIGSIPAEIGDLHNLRHLDLSGNSLLTGAIPKEIGNLQELTFLDLSGCDLSGVLSQELSSLRKLEFLDLSNNPRLHSNEESSEYTSFSESSSAIQQSSAFNSRSLLRHRALLQAPGTAPNPVPGGPTSEAPSPSPSPIPGAPTAAPPAAPPTPTRTYLMYAGIGAFCLVILSVAVSCLCRKFGQLKIRGAQRLPPLPRYH